MEQQLFLPNYHTIVKDGKIVSKPFPIYEKCKNGTFTMWVSPTVGHNYRNDGEGKNISQKRRTKGVDWKAVEFATRKEFEAYYL